MASERDKGAMASERDNFDKDGPSQLVDNVVWSNKVHVRSVIASLVEGVYQLEHFRMKDGLQAVDSRWWTFFNFRLLQPPLTNGVDGCIFGAIYEFVPPLNFNHLLTPEVVPRYVIAFRGTINLEDIKLDAKIITNTLHHTSQLKIAMEKVHSTVDTYRNSNIWLAGHSLGAAMAMLAGKTMAKNGTYLKTFLFNPPIVSIPFETIIKNENVKMGIQITSNFIKAARNSFIKAAAAGKQSNSLEEDRFKKLCGWNPCLYVNQGDIICSGYIRYFEQMEMMKGISAGGVWRRSKELSFWGLLRSAMGKESKEQLHLIPSAILFVNSTPAESFIDAHKLHQWWSPDLILQQTLYKYM